MAILARGGLVGLGHSLRAEPIQGDNVAIWWRAELPDGTVRIRRASPPEAVAAIRPAADLSLYQARWLQIAATIAPAAVPRLLFRDEATQALVLAEPLPIGMPAWLQFLGPGLCDPSFAEAVGLMLAAMHGATAGHGEVAAQFPTDPIFRTQRLDAWLTAGATAHPDLAPMLLRLVRRTAAAKLALVHGNPAPATILVGPTGPILQEPECPWYGDPAFDLAFCLCHLLLLGGDGRAGLERVTAAEALAGAYLDGVVWEPRSRLEARAASLLPGLLAGAIELASLHGSLVASGDKPRILAVAREGLFAPPPALPTLFRAWRDSLARGGAEDSVAAVA